MRLFLSLVVAWASCAAAAERRIVTLLATTDLHGNIYPVDYYTNRPAARGLAQIATLVRQARAENPATLLVDCGDTIQGTPLESVYQSLVRTGRMPLGLPAARLAHDPMMLAMNRLGYDAMTVGNHEFNFGLKNLERARSDARFPWIAANIEAGAGGKAFPPYVVKNAGGVKVAIIGLTTPAVPTWEKPENIGPYRFLPARAALDKALAELRAGERPDLVIVAAHAGLGRDLKTGAVRGQGENFVYALAAGAPEVDAIVFGHSHQQLPGYRVGPVLLVQPKNWGISLARLDFVLERGAGGRWTVAGKSSRLIPVSRDTRADPEILELARPYHEAAERYLNTRVADAPRDLDARLGRVRDSALVDAVHLAQMHYAQGARAARARDGPADRGAVYLRERALCRGRRRRHAQRGAGERGAVFPLMPGTELPGASPDQSGDDGLQLRHGAGRGVPDRPGAARGPPHPQPALSRAAPGAGTETAHRSQ
jgi:2',3'-cyclic-nucleotide 2'-phosphodiesterase/3'-nucleotidase